MRVYYLVVLSVLMFSLLAQKYDYPHPAVIEPGERIRHSFRAKWLFFVLSVLLICAAGLRYRVGADYPTYFYSYYAFANRLTEALRSLDEPGYPLIAAAAIRLGGGGALTIFLASLITVGLSLRTIYLGTNALCYSVLLFLFLGCWHASFNAVRQCLAAAFVFSGYLSLRDKKFFQYAFLVFLAYCCHKSAILLIIPYFVSHRKINFLNLLLTTAGTIAVLYSYNLLFSLVESVLDQEVVGEEYYYRSVNVLRVLSNCAPAAFFVVYLWRREKSDGVTFHLNLLILHALINIITINSAYLARIAIYTAPFAALSMGELSKTLSEKNRKLIMSTILALFFVFWLYELSHNTSLKQFRFIWEQ